MRWQHQKNVLLESDIPDTSEGVVRRLSYTYYYDWETDDPDYMLLVQDPGNLHKRHLEELRGSNPLADGCPQRDQIHVYRQFGKSWLTGRNADFSEKFFGTLDEFGLIGIGEDWETYLESERMYQDFYLGDGVKYRTDGFGRKAEDVSYDRFLIRSKMPRSTTERIFTPRDTLDILGESTRAAYPSDSIQ